MADRRAIQKNIRVQNQRAASYDTPDLTGRVRQREPARDLMKSSGGSPKASQAIKDALHGDEMATSAIKRGAYGGAQKSTERAHASARLSDRRWSKAEALAESAGGRMTEARIDRMRRAVTRGLLSPAGLAEDVVARVAKHMGADEEPMYEKMAQRKRLTKPVRRTY